MLDARTGTDRLVSIEAGGTKFNVGVGNSAGILTDQAQFRTTTPAETLDSVAGWIEAEVRTRGPVDAIGVASFGPVDIDPGSARWGEFGATPKLEWRGANILTPLHRFCVPVALDTDVNGAALAEWSWGAGQDKARVCYLTVGTGIGGGAVVDGKTLSGRHHAEMGHMFVRRHPQDDFAGNCPAHGDCVEGLASGTAIAARWGQSLSGLPGDHPGHAIIAFYLAQTCLNIATTLAPDCILLGGGVMETPGLLDRVKTEFDRLSNGYLSNFTAADIRLAHLFPISGLQGGLAIAASRLKAAT